MYIYIICLIRSTISLVAFALPTIVLVDLTSFYAPLMFIDFCSNELSLCKHSHDVYAYTYHISYHIHILLYMIHMFICTAWSCVCSLTKLSTNVSNIIHICIYAYISDIVYI